MKKYRFDDPDFVKRLQGLVDDEKLDQFFDLVQEALTEDPDYTVTEIVSNPAKAKTKLMQIREFIKRYTEREEYEKCAPLRDIVNRVEAMLNK